MKRLRTIFKKLEGIFLNEIPTEEVQEIKYMTEYQVNYYEAVVIHRHWPLSVREALDCVDFVVLNERTLVVMSIGPEWRLYLKVRWIT